MIQLVTPDAAAIEADLAPVVAIARDITITDAPSHEEALMYLTEIARRDKFVKDIFADPKKKAFDAHRAITALEARLLEPLKQARIAVNVKIVQYEDAERARAEAEAARLAEEARQREEERQLMDASLAEDAGRPIEAAEIMAAPVVAPVVEVRPETAKVAGVTTATRYRAEVTDLMALIKHVGAHPEHVNLLAANGPALNALARSLREAMSVPGVRVIRERDTRVRVP